MREEQQRIDDELRPHLEALADDLREIKRKKDEGVDVFLRYLLEHHVPANQKFELTEEMLKEANVSRTITLRYSKIFHPDRNVNEERRIRVFREEIMKLLNSFVERNMCAAPP